MPGFLLTMTILALVGCRTQPARPAQPTTSTSFEVIPPPLGPAALPPEPQEGDTRRVYQSALPATEDLVLPIYPKPMLGTPHAWAVVGIRITIDTAGAISDTSLSPMVPSMPFDPPEPFLAAIRAATAQWRFRPATYVTQTYVRTQSDTLRWRATGTELTQSFTDLRFSFTASGHVKLGE